MYLPYTLNHGIALDDSVNDGGWSLQNVNRRSEESMWGAPVGLPRPRRAEKARGGLGAGSTTVHRQMSAATSKPLQVIGVEGIGLPK